VDDSSVEGTHTDTITHAISSSDTNYSGVTISNITVTITDNDSGSGSGGSPVYGGDTTPPTNTSVVINSNATSTASANVTLTIGASDAASMMIANTSDFTSAIWETYNTTKAWTLTSGAGTKTVYAKFRDANNNVSTAVSDTIVLLSTATTPTATTTPVTATTTAPVSPVVTPTEKSITQLPATTPTVVVSQQGSALVVTPPADTSYQQTELLKFKYSYKNTSAKTTSVKIMRQLLDSKGKIIRTTSASKILKSGKSFVGDVKEEVGKALKPGEYVVRVRIMDSGGKKVLEEGSFKIDIEKVKQKYFVFGEASVSSDIVFDSVKLGGTVKNMLLPVNLKAQYTYTNNSGFKHVVRMTRELIGPNGKVIDKRTGRWVMKADESDSANFTQAITKYFDTGGYQIRIRAYDWTTKELLAENSLGFAVELK
jgi:hypothetical protein